jgi:hypothetical protein
MPIMPFIGVLKLGNPLELVCRINEGKTYLISWDMLAKNSLTQVS